ncbi:MAG: hypothetical protein ACYSX0_00835, partial [Planctomycetota bacterium]
RFDVLAGVQFDYYLQNFKVSRTRQAVAAHVDNLDTGAEHVVLIPLETLLNKIITPDGMTDISDLGITRDGEWVYFTGVHEGLRALFAYVVSDNPQAAEKVLSDVRFGVWQTVAGLVVRQGNDVLLVEWDFTITKISDLGDPDAYPRVSVNKSGTDLVYSKDDELIHIDFGGYTDTGLWIGGPVSRPSDATGDIRGDEAIIIDESFCLFEGNFGTTTALVETDLNDLSRTRKVPGSEGVIKYDSPRFGDNYWFKTGLGTLWTGTPFGETQLITDTAFVSSPRISPDGLFVGFTASESLFGKPIFHISLIDGSHEIEVPYIDGHDMFTFGKGALSVAGTPVFWGANESSDRSIRSGVASVENDQVILRAGASYDMNDSLRFVKLNWRFDRFEENGDPTDAVVAELTFQGFNFLAFGRAVLGGRFPPIPVGFEGSAKPMGYTKGPLLAPEITLLDAGALLFLRGSYTGFGMTWGGVDYEREIAVSIDEDGIMHWYEWGNGPLAVLQMAHGEWRLELTGPQWVLIEDGFPGLYEGQLKPDPAVQTTNQFVRKWMDPSNLLIQTFFPDNADKTTGFDLQLVVQAGLIQDFD